MKMCKEDVDRLTEKAIRDLLKRIIERLDDLDSEDFFGSEGWRRLFGFDE